MKKLKCQITNFTSFIMWRLKSFFSSSLKSLTKTINNPFAIKRIKGKLSSKQRGLNKLSIPNIKLYTLNLTLLLCTVSAFAGITNFQQVYSSRELYKTTPSLSFKITDKGVQEETSSNFDVSRKTFVGLRYTRNNHTDKINEHDWSYRIIYTVTNDATEHELKVTYSKKSDQTAIYETRNVHDNNLSTSEITIKNVYWKYGLLPEVSIKDNGINSSIADDIELFIEMKRERYSRFNPYDLPAINLTPDFSNNVLTIDWEERPGAEEYEVQWTFVDDQENRNGASLYSYWNTKEPANIKTKNNQYKIDLNYPKGILLVRVRGVGRILTSEGGSSSHLAIKQGEWGLITMGGTNTKELAIPSSFESDKNWTYAVTFAEDGKYKSVINYFDEGLKSRQTLTNFSSKNITVAAETKYNFEGVQAVSVLPAPLQGRTLTYQSNLNQVGNNPFSAQHFDQGVANRVLPSTTSEGASKYFSENNSFTSDPFRDRLPNLEGYVYSQVKYESDGTGKVKSQGGIGEDFAIGSGHETKYYYGTPNQTELNRLFGSNVGEAVHYKKNMVIDPNGSMSIAYIDQEGRTIATALAGNSPDNLKELDSRLDENITVNITKNNVVDYENLTSITRHSFTTTEEDASYNFEYDLTGIIYRDVYEYETLSSYGTPQTNLARNCESCQYELTFFVEDENGTKQILDGTTQTEDVSIISGNIGSFCSESDDDGYKEWLAAHVKRYDITLKSIGTYTVYKKLKVITTEDQSTFETRTGFDQNYLGDLIESNTKKISCNECSNVCEDHALAEAIDIYFTEANGNLDLLSTFGCISASTLVENIEELNAGNTLTDNLGLSNAEWQELYTEYQSKLSICDYDQTIIEDVLTEGNQTLCKSKLNALKDDIHPDKAYYDDSDFWNDVDQKGLLEEINNQFETSYNGVQDLKDLTKESFNTDYQDILVEAHIEYCHYEACIEDEADIFLSTLRNQATDWDNAKTSGWDTPFESGFDNQLPILNNNSADFETVLNDYNNGVGLWQDIENTIATATSEGTDFDAWASFVGLYGSVRADFIKSKREAGCPYVQDGHFEEKPEVNREDYTSNSNVTDDFPEVETDVDEMMYSMTDAAIEMKLDACMNRLFSECNNGISQIHYNKIRSLLKNKIRLIEPSENPALLIRSNDINSWTDISDYISNNNITCSGNSLLDLNNLIPPADEQISYIYDRDENGEIIYERKKFLHNNTKELFRYINEVLLKDANFTRPLPYWSGINNPHNGSLDGYQVTYFDNSLWHNENDKDDGLGIMHGPAELEDCDGNTHILTMREFALYKRIYESQGPHYQYSMICPEILNKTDLSFFGFGIFEKGTIVRVCDLRNCSYIKNIVPEKIWSTRKRVTATVGIYQGNNEIIEKEVDIYNNGTEPFYDFKNVPRIIGIETPSSATELTPEDYALETCIEDQISAAKTKAQDIFTKLETKAKDNSYKSKFNYCFAFDESTNTGFRENLQYTYKSSEYHYTLYYYDQAGNLVQTVPPAGVDKLPMTEFDAEGNYLENNEPDHKLTTRYKYNSLNQITYQSTPDGGESWFYYNDAGQLRYSQNARQKERTYNSDLTLASTQDKSFSYTKYNNRGEVIETGECTVLESANGPTTLTTELNNSNFPDLPENTQQVTKISYDQGSSFSVAQSKEGDNLRGRIADVSYFESGDQLSPSSATIYDYSVEGVVDKLTQFNNDLNYFGSGFKDITYEYDLISGNVNEVHYSENSKDQFHHKYYYNEDNQITKVKTSKDGIIYTDDAQYLYNATGMLMRTELGDQIQGIDYLFNGQGWMMGANSGTLETSEDLGLDGNVTFSGAGEQNKNSNFARDAFGYVLGYFKDAYQSINPTAKTKIFSTHTGANETELGAELYNGNISHTIMSNYSDPLNGESVAQNILTGYRYDQLNRLTSTGQGRIDHGVLHLPSNTNPFVIRLAGYEYDANGNLLQLVRYAKGQVMDDFDYRYAVDADNRLATNRLYAVDENVGPTADFVNDLEQVGTALGSNPSHSNAIQSDNQNQATYNYQYDPSGNLIADASEQIAEIKWTVDGKVSEVIRTAGSKKPNLEFHYGPDRNRIAKIVKTKDDQGNINNNDQWTQTYYVRDAQGNVMAIYDLKYTQPIQTNNEYIGQADLKIKERNGYGTSRLFVDKTEELLSNSEINYGSNNQSGKYDIENANNITTTLLSTSPLTKGNNTVGNKTFELSNHLGNVLATVTDRKFIHEAPAETKTFTTGFEKEDANIFNSNAPYQNNLIAINQGRGAATTDNALELSFSTSNWGSHILHKVNPGDIVSEISIWAKNEQGLGYGAQLKSSLVKLNPDGTTELLYSIPGTNAYSPADWRAKRLQNGIKDYTKLEFDQQLVVPQIMYEEYWDDMKKSYQYREVDMNNVYLNTYPYLSNNDYQGGLTPTYFDDFKVTIQTPSGTTTLSSGFEPDDVNIFTKRDPYSEGTVAINKGRNASTSNNAIMLSISNNRWGPGVLKKVQIGDVITDVSIWANNPDGQGKGANLASKLIKINPDGSKEILYSTINGTAWNPADWRSNGLQNGEIGYHKLEFSDDIVVPQMYEEYWDDATQSNLYREADMNNVYLYVHTYLSNADNPTPTYFDDLNVEIQYAPREQYVAEITSAKQYWPFGMEVEEYSWVSEGTRHGFNGMEKDDEMYGKSGASYDFGARMYNPAIGRWLARDKYAGRAPNLTPYRYGFNDPIRYTDPDGNWESDGHYWTVYALGVAMGMGVVDAAIYAEYAEYDDNYVPREGVFKTTPYTEFSTTPYAMIFYIFTGGDMAGTWMDAKGSEVKHGLTGNLQSVELERAFTEIFKGNTTFLHLLGDVWAHSFVNDEGRRQMFGAHKPWYMGGRTLQHALQDQHGEWRFDDHTDEIHQRKYEYEMYLNSLQLVFNSKKFSGNIFVKNPNPSMNIFKYVQKNGVTYENNVSLLQNYVNWKGHGDTSFHFDNKEQTDLWTGYLNGEMDGTWDYNVQEYKTKDGNGSTYCVEIYDCE